MLQEQLSDCNYIGCKNKKLGYKNYRSQTSYDPNAMWFLFHIEN